MPVLWLPRFSDGFTNHLGCLCRNLSRFRRCIGDGEGGIGDGNRPAPHNRELSQFHFAGEGGGGNKRNGEGGGGGGGLGGGGGGGLGGDGGGGLGGGGGGGEGGSGGGGEGGGG